MCLFATTAAPMLASWFYQSLSLFSFVLHSFLYYHVGGNLHYGFSAEQAGELLTPSIAWNVIQTQTDTP